jgi:hypothetical protein
MNYNFFYRKPFRKLTGGGAQRHAGHYHQQHSPNHHEQLGFGSAFISTTSKLEMIIVKKMFLKGRD